MPVPCTKASIRKSKFQSDSHGENGLRERTETETTGIRMAAQVYEVILHVVGSAVTGGGAFVVGLSIGWLVWKGARPFRKDRPG